MKSRLAAGVTLVIAILMLAAVACENTPAVSPGPSEPRTVPEPTPAPEAAVPSAATVTGTITYLERMALASNAVVEVKLLDVSRADAPAVTIGEQTITSPGQVPVGFEIEYDPSRIDDRFSYAVRATIMEGDRMVFTTDTQYSVITRDSPTHVDMVLVRTIAPQTQLSTPLPPKMIEVPAPVERVDVIVSGSNYALRVVSGLPSGCVEFNGYELTRDDTVLTVTVSNLEPAEPVLCTMNYRSHEEEIDLGELEPGQTYTITINDTLTNSFTVRDVRTKDWVVGVSPIEAVEVMVSESNPPEYSLNVSSRLPRGSSCSRFNGYEVVRRSDESIEVTMTYLMVPPTQLVACTADLPIVRTDVPLGDEFTSGETYAVKVNGELTNSFTVRNEETAGWVTKESPVENVEIVVLESFPPQYQLRVISRLTRGSSCSVFHGYDVSRPFANTINVNVTHMEVAETNVSCTRDLPVVETMVPLGTDFKPGEEYTVNANDVTETFKAQ